MIKQLMDAGSGSMDTPEVRVSFEDCYLGEGITGLKGVLLSMGIHNGNAANDVSGKDFFAEKETDTRLKTVVSLRIVLTSLELGPEKMEELTEKVVAQLHRALEF